MTKVNQNRCAKGFYQSCPQTRSTFYEMFLAGTAFCWAYALASMLRHSLNTFLGELRKRYSTDRGQNKIDKAYQFLNCLNSDSVSDSDSDSVSSVSVSHVDFHKQLRNEVFNVLIKYFKLNIRGFRSLTHQCFKTHSNFKL